MSEETFKDFEMIGYEKSGKIITIIVRGDEDEQLERVGKLKPILVETLPITVEEVFISRLRQLGYGSMEVMEEVLK